MSIEIKKNVPVQERSKYPWDKMEIGDCFDIPLVGAYTAHSNGRPSIPPRLHAQGFRIAIRRLSGEGVLRIWRVA